MPDRRTLDPRVSVHRHKAMMYETGKTDGNWFDVDNYVLSSYGLYSLL